MAEVEKGLIKEQYGRIGKEDENGVIVKDMDEDTSGSSKWLEKKSSLIYDYEDDTLSFSRSKPTEF